MKDSVSSAMTAVLIGVDSIVAPPNPIGRVRLNLKYDLDLEILEVVVHEAEYVCHSLSLFY